MASAPLMSGNKVAIFGLVIGFRWVGGVLNWIGNLAVSVQCVNLGKLSKGEGSSGMYECSALSCAWKAPRVLTGSLASTPLPQCSSSQCEGRRLRSNPAAGLNSSKILVSS